MFYLFIKFLQTSSQQWRIIFFIAAGYNFLANLLFIIFGSAEMQPWHNEEVKVQELQPLNQSSLVTRSTDVAKKTATV